MRETVFAVTDTAHDELQERIDALDAKLDRVLEAVEQLDRRRDELEELVVDLMPAVNGTLGLASRRLTELEQDGTLPLLRSLVPRLPAALQSAHALSAPEITDVAQAAVAALAAARKGRPPAWRALLAARKEPRVRRGVAALLDMLRALGSGSSHPASAVAPPAPAPRRAVSAAVVAHCPAPVATPAAAVRNIAGTPVSFDAEGFMTDSAQWTRAIGQAIAAEAGLASLTDAHWRVIEFCRAEAAHAGVSPGLRRITQQLEIPPKEMYALFPRGPGILAARIAGLAKPRSCV